MATPENRKYRRFNLKCPVHLTFRSGDSMMEVDTVSRDLSVHGLLLESNRVIPYRTPVEFTITLQAGPTARPIYLSGKGEVVRVGPGETANRVGIAVECAEPIAQIGDHLSRAAGGNLP